MPKKNLSAVAGLLLALCVVSTCRAATGAAPPRALDRPGQPGRGEGDAGRPGPAASKEAVPFLKDHLKPVKADTKRVAQLIEQLDSDDFAKREEAAVELDYFGKFIKADLEKAVAAKPSAEVKKRMQGLLDRIAGEEAVPGAPPALAGRSAR